MGIPKKLIAESPECQYKKDDNNVFTCLPSAQAGNTSCVNPNHLFIGTNEDNIRDRDQKGRTAKGEKINTSKLTESDVRQIKTLLSQGISQTEIGRLFKVHRNTIKGIKHGRSWKHITH